MASNGTFKEALKCIKEDKAFEIALELLSVKKAGNLEELRECFNIGQVWWDEVLKDMFLTTTFKKVS